MTFTKALLYILEILTEIIHKFKETVIIHMGFLSIDLKLYPEKLRYCGKWFWAICLQ
jgi:hypothetical protein